MPYKPLVVIVDDDQSIRSGTRDLLKSAGYLTAEFEDANSFLASVDRAAVACLIADVRMPGMSGFELYEALVRAGELIPTVLITAHPEEAARSRAREAGIKCYLSKPFAPDDLLRCVCRALARSQAGPIPKS